MFRKNSKPNNLNESLMPILIFNLIFGHQIMPHTMDGYKFIQAVFYFILVIFIYGASMGYSILAVVNAAWFKYSESVYFLAVGANILIMPVNFILGWVHRNKLLLINIKSLNIDKKLMRMGVILHEKKTCNFATKVVIYWLFCAVTINFAAIIWNMKTLNWFKKINEELIKLEYNSHVTNIRGNDNKPVYILQLSKEIHLELEQQCGKITRIFGIQLIMLMASLFILMTVMIYNLYVTLFGRNIPDWALRISIIAFWIIIHCSKLLFINHICSRTVNEWKKTGVIIHKLESKFANAEICKTIQQLSIQMIQNPLQIYPLGFIQLGHSFLQGFFGTLATYLIISIQMAPINGVIGEPIDNQRAFRYSLAVSICWIITSVLLSYNKIAWFKMNIPLIRKVAIIFVTQYPFYINLLADLIFCLSINHIKIRFESLNNVLKTFVSDDNFENRITSDNLFFTRSKKISEDKWAIRKSENVDVIKIIQTIKYLHLELGILSGEFMKTYGLQLILGFIASFGHITHVLLFIYFVVQTKSQSTNDRIIQTAGSIVTVAINSFKMIFVNRICSETILEYQKTGELIHKLEIQTEDIKLKKEIQQFSIQILQNPLIFSPCGLLNLGYPFIKDFAGTVTAQLLILIQTSDESAVLYSSFNETAKSQMIYDRSLKVDKKLEDLGVAVNCQKTFTYSFIVTIIFIITALLLNLMTVLWSVSSDDAVADTFAIFALNHPIHMNYVFSLTFCMLIRHMRLRFRKINKALRKFITLQSNDSILIENNESITENRIILNQTSRRLNHSLQTLKNIHLELTSLCEKITHIFGVQLIMTIVSSFVLITSLSYDLYLTARDPKWSQTGRIIHNLKSKSQDTDLCLTIQKFSLQMLQNPLKFSPCGFIDLGFPFVRDRACVINKRSSKIDKSLEYLGVPVNRQQSYNYSLKLIVIWIISVFLLNIIVALLPTVQIKGFLRKIMMAFIIQHPIHVNALIDFTFCSLILLMKLRFKSVNEALLKFRIIYSYNLPVINLNREVNNDFTRQKTPEHSFVVFKILKDAHLELTNICNNITEIFGCQLIMTILSSFILITTMLYNLYSSTVNEEITFVQKVSNGIIFTSWVLHSSFKFIFINYTCSGTICEWKRTSKLIHKLEIKSYGTDFSEEIQRFSIQIIKNPLIFTPCGLINLSYKLIRNVRWNVKSWSTRELGNYNITLYNRERIDGARRGDDP
ncbi:hypothetical protein KQX54_005287 [Cotesia glomerata]|uniref:Gustatory receptor n=1 Tax=Cotesia glomerata TaxID=32391 RepID=A0AAV7ICV4_COTGL|nr:hypothetical protein KQX54_005287 [Cotesia glomerata]